MSLNFKRLGSILGGFALVLLVHTPPAAAQKALNQPAPELVGASWLNTSRNAPVTLASRKGKVTIVHFWTFGCINCKHNLPSYSRWQNQFGKRDVAILGVHTPEFDYERRPENVARFLRDENITYPVLLDAGGENWSRWRQRYWPTVYLIDRRGRIRYVWEGELEYDRAGGEAKMARLVDALLQER